MLGGIPSFDDWETRERKLRAQRKRLVEIVFTVLCAATVIGGGWMFWWTAFYP